MAALMEEALEALERFIETGSRDQAQEAFDCLRACGLFPLCLGDGDSWDVRFAEQLYFSLVTN
jgi:hypothetical protein